MSTPNTMPTPTGAFFFFQHLRARGDQGRWERAVAGLSNLSLKVYETLPGFQVIDGKSAYTAAVYDHQHFTCSCKEFTNRLQKQGAACRHLIAAGIHTLLPLALDGARERQAHQWIEYLEGLQKALAEAQAAAAEAAERAAIQADAPSGDAKAPDRPAAPPAKPDPAPDNDQKTLPATCPGNGDPPPPSPPNATGHAPNGSTPHMVLKRSLSPDGRIDSLSIEIDFAVTGMSREQLQAKALKLITLQEAIARQYLERYRAATRTPATNGGPAPSNGAGAMVDTREPQPATLIEIGRAKNGKCFASFELANRQWAKMFRPEKGLAKALAPLGIRADAVREGARLHVPCLVQATRNGQYLNADRVFPVPTTH